MLFKILIAGGNLVKVNKRVRTLDNALMITPTLKYRSCDYKMINYKEK